MYNPERDILHPAVDLLLRRMDSHPEEFTPQPARWDWDSLMGKYKEFLNQWERDALRETMRRIMLDDMHRTLMEDLLTGSSNLSTVGFLYNPFTGEEVETTTMQGELNL
jgi:hypothetical protein